MINIFFVALTLSLIGKVLLAFGVLMAHTQLAHEHRVDARVIKSFRLEKALTIIGVLLIIVGYVLEIHFFGGFGNFWTCGEADCQALLYGAVD